MAQQDNPSSSGDEGASLGAGVLPTATVGPLTVTRLWFGGAPIAGLYNPVSDEDAWATLEAAWEGGVRAFDVAPLYGSGLAERRVGAFLATKPRDEFVLSTKVGRLLVRRDRPVDHGTFAPSEWDPEWDFSGDGVRRSLEESLERMGLDRVDVALIHDPDDHFTEARQEAYPALEALRADGVVRAIGLGMNQTEMLERFVRETDIDCVLVAGRYSLIDDRAADGLLPAAAERSVAVLVAGVFNSGILATPGPGATFNYEPAAADLVARAQAIAALAADYDVPLPQLAIQWPLRHPAVTSAVVGMRAPAEVAANLRYLSLPVPEELWERLAASGLLGWTAPAN
ncbi:MAG TPA: aldo/keto reductase [Acidimicrobiales bacterium]|nr:aldo/keto reductase [Acidimicrobiales bacterium]